MQSSMKILSVIIGLAISGVAYPGELEADSFLGIGLGEVDSESLRAFGKLKSSINYLCYTDGKRSAIFQVDNEPAPL